MRVGATVLVHGLVARPELNGVRGTVVKAADPKSGRVGVRLDEGGSAMALKPSNLTDVAQEATAAVLSDPDLLRAILSYGKRWERSGIYSGVCSHWRSCTWTADMYRSVVVVGAMPPPPRERARGLHRAKPLGARLFVEEGALPLVASQLARIPDPSWVEQLFVEECPDELWIAPVMEAVLTMNFPSLTTLLLSNVDAYCDGGILGERDGSGGVVRSDPSPLYVKKARAAACADFVSRHLRKLQHLHLTPAIVELTEHGQIAARVAIFDVGAQPGLACLQLNGSYDKELELEAIHSWPASHRRRLQTLHLTDYPSVPSLVAMLALLPNLRRLGWRCSEPDTETFTTLATALATSKVEAVYLSIDSSDLSHDDFDAFARVPTLKELVVVCDSCEIIRRLPDVDPTLPTRDEPSYAEVTSRLCTILGGCAVLVCDCYSLEHDLDPLHRLLLPTSEEEWHLEPGAHGLQHLDFLTTGEARELQLRVRKLDELWHGWVLRSEPDEVRSDQMELPGEVYDAACEGDATTVEAWLDGGGHVDARLLEEDGAQGTLLLCAASSGGGRDSMVELLLRRGATPDLQNLIGWTALMGAAFEGNTAVVRRLLQSRANPDMQNRNGNTALSIARQRHHAEIVGLLCQFGAQAPTEDTAMARMMQLFAQFPEHTAVHHLA